ncbi:LGFP repeat-containing protein [Microbacterium sp. NPDC057659]|uniref:LGFP repeat-containing protein n=1 Tax=Microbacterium sp. NPDC057659 TaxID=3346198 RepID=UPI00366D7C62
MSRRSRRPQKSPRISRILTAVVAAAALSLSVLMPATAASAAPAGGPVKASLVGFSAGNIISDAVFTAKGSMTEAQIQSFFNSKVKTCQSGYTCLKDFRITSVTRPADAYCKGYTGAANESAARIIYRVSQSCNINPQVLIVMLQKEQGLVTHTWPSQWRYDKALGQACPDTAPCDPKFIGFFHQIYGAARQMNLYMEGKYFTWYAPGKTWNIRYSPNSACGSSPVYVANKATSALYYYTPYQPNAAALRAGYGTGDSCSAYGNRNFYNYFTDWFGSTQKPASTTPSVTGAIATEWTRLGGAGGALGQPTTSATTVTANGGGQVQKFAKGTIWLKSGATRAFGMALGPFLTNYEKAGAQGGSWGWPASVATCGLLAGGCRMEFQNGTTFYSPDTQSVLVPKSIAPAYAKAGNEKSVFGYPKAPSSASAGAVQQAFVNGLGVYTATAGLVRLSNGVAKTWGGLGSSLGLPLADAKASTANGGGAVQEFSKGTIWESPAGAFAMAHGALRTSYVKANGPAGAWGWPAGAATCRLSGGGCVMAFTKGTIGYSAETGSVLMSTAVAKEWLRLDPASVGYPKAVATANPANGGGTVQEFTKGTFWQSGAGAFAMGYGALRTAYLKAGGPAGAWGWPAAAAKCGLVGGGCSMPFTKGTVGYSGATGAVLMSAGVTKEWQRLGPASIGYPRTAAKAIPQNGGGTLQEFSKGTFWESPVGAFAMGNGALRTAYVKSSGAAGAWGWPAAAAKCGLPGGDCTMAFTKGTATYDGTTGRVSFR